MSGTRRPSSDQRKPRDKRPREGNPFGAATTAPPSFARAPPQQQPHSGTSDEPPAAVETTTTSVAAGSGVLQQHRVRFNTHTVPQWIAKAFVDSWCWRRVCVRRVAAGSHDTATGTSKSVAPPHAPTRASGADELSEAFHPGAPRGLAVVGEVRGPTSTAFSKRLVHQFAGDHSSLDACDVLASPVMISTPSYTPVIPVSPSQQLYAEVSAARGGHQASLRFSSRETPVVNPLRSRGAVPPLAAPSQLQLKDHQRGLLLAPGVSLSYFSASGCYGLVDHISKRVFLDVDEAPRTAHLWSGVTQPMRSAGVEQAEPMNELHVPPLLRKSMQYMTAKERKSTWLRLNGVEAACNETLPVPTPPLEHVAAPTTIDCSACELYAEVQSALMRQDHVPLSYYDDPHNSGSVRHPTRSGALKVALPPGSYVDDEWVVNHILGVATHQLVSSSARYPEVNVSTPWHDGGSPPQQNPLLDSRRPFFAVVVPSSSRRSPTPWMVWQEVILGALKEVRCNRLVFPMSCLDLQSELSEQAASLTIVGRLLQQLGTVRSPDSAATSLVDVLRQTYTHHQLLFDADGTFDLCCLLGDSRRDALFYQRWRHLAGRRVTLAVGGVWADQSHCCLVVQSLQVAADADAEDDEGTSATRSELEVPPYSFLPIAFNGSVDSLEDVCQEPTMAALGQLVAEWLLSTTVDAGAVGDDFWAREVLPFVTSSGVHDAAVVRFEHHITLQGQVRLS